MLQTIDPAAYDSMKGNLTDMLDALQGALDVHTQVRSGRACEASTALLLVYGVHGSTHAVKCSTSTLWLAGKRAHVSMGS